MVKGSMSIWLDLSQILLAVFSWWFAVAWLLDISPRTDAHV